MVPTWWDWDYDGGLSVAYWIFKTTCVLSVLVTPVPTWSGRLCSRGYLSRHLCPPSTDLTCSLARCEVWATSEQPRKLIHSAPVLSDLTCLNLTIGVLREYSGWSFWSVLMGNGLSERHFCALHAPFLRAYLKGFSETSANPYETWDTDDLSRQFS